MKRILPFIVSLATALPGCAGGGNSYAHSQSEGSIAAEEHYTPVYEETTDIVSDTTLSLRERALALHDAYITIDTHADTPLRVREGQPLGKAASKVVKNGKKIRVTLPAMRQGHASAQYLACWVAQGPLTDAGRSNARTRVEQLIDICYREAKSNAGECGIARTPAEVRALKEEGKIALLIGVENGYGVGKDLDWLNHYADRGVTYLTLCHTKNNDICDSSSDASGARWKGLSPFGEKVVERMNDLGMVIDLSHASDSTVWDVLRLSKAPVMASHSSARALNRHDRNLTDDMIRAIAEKGGVIQVDVVPSFIKRGATATFDDYMAHLLHIIKVAGPDHVGIGTDFDGGGGVPGFDSPADLPNVTERLIKAGYNDSEIAGILGGNYLRMLEQVQSLATIK